MNVRRFVGESFVEAVALAKKALGTDAVVLQSRPVRKGRWLGLGGGKLWEVKAACGAEFLAESAFDPNATKGYIPTFSRGVEAPGEPGRFLPVADVQARRATQQMREELAGIRQLLSGASAPEKGTATREPTLSGELQAARERLLQAQLPAGRVCQLIQAAQDRMEPWHLSDPAALEAFFCNQLARSIPVASPAQLELGRVVALIGVTGVGKTTTLAKLAGLGRIQQHRRVALVTMDTYRIAAVDQLRTYADIIDLPMEVVLTPGEMAAAVRKLESMDLILIDTAGRSQRSDASLHRLKEFLDAAGTDQRHLVMPATFGLGQVRDVARRFAPLEPTHTIVSKTDEAVTLGQTLEALEVSGSPLSYVTTGQDVPNDLQPVSANRLARWIVTGLAGEDVCEFHD